MIVVIQCAGTKRADSGTFRAADGRPIQFVARPELAPQDGALWAHPDDDAGDGVSWREKLVRYNARAGQNPLGLLPASELYSPAVYAALAGNLGSRRLFILSAGWGLISGDFFVPDYDITFSAQAEPHKRRTKRDH